MTERHPSSTLFPYTTLFRSVPYRYTCPDPVGAWTVLPPRIVVVQGPQDTCDFIAVCRVLSNTVWSTPRSEEHTSELQSHSDLVCRLLLEKKKKKISQISF